METENWSNDIANLEVEYLSLFGAAIARCVEEVLIISYISLTASTKENYHQLKHQVLTPAQVRVAIEHSCLTSAVSKARFVSSKRNLVCLNLIFSIS